jgi:hypothetical protein
MKNQGKIQYFAGAVLAVIVAGFGLAGCFNVFEGGQEREPGEAAVVWISLGGSAARATLLPAVPVFSTYSLRFTGKSGQTPVADITGISPAEISGTGKSVTLEAGGWTITATGYVTLSGISGLADGDYPAARGSADIVVTPGQTLAVPITIDPITGEGEGVVNYNVPFPAYATTAVLEVLNLDETPLSPPVSVNLKNGSSGTLVVPAGYYFLKVTVSRTGIDAESAVVMDVLHVYGGMTTNVNLTNDFTIIQRTVISGAALDLSGLITPPVEGRPPDTGPVDTQWYTGTASWKDGGGNLVTGNFSWATAYTAVLTLTAKDGFTFAGIGADTFTCTGAAAVTNAAGSGTVSIAYPSLPSSLQDAAVLRYAVDGAAFTAVPSTGSSWNAVLNSGASVTTVEGFKVVDVGANNGYVDLGSQAGTLIKTLPEFSIETYVYVPSETDLSGNGHFVWILGSTNTATQTAGSYMFFRSGDQAFSISQAGWGSGQSTAGKGNIGKGLWKHIVVTRATDHTTTVYVNGVALDQKDGEAMTIDHAATEFSALTYCYLARPLFSGDKYLKNARCYRFNVYGTALSASEVAEGLGAAEILTAFNKTPAPLITNDTYAKTSSTEKFVSFILDDYYTGTGKVYTAATGGSAAPGITAGFNRNILTLTADGSDVPAGEYYVTLTEEFARESDRVKLTITPYVPPPKVITVTFGGIPSDPIAVSGGGVSVSQSGGPVIVTLNNATGFTDYQWWLDGEEQVSQTGSSYSIAVTGLSAGTHWVMLIAYKNGVPYSGETSFTVTN